ncbi:hypothetical protein [Thalassobellus sediminis]|uniref:hypothetical protein n=1 Tax=Thalassobellus sediminis TaxID=3367753 RepID=UPI0037BC0686
MGDFFKMQLNVYYSNSIVLSLFLFSYFVYSQNEFSNSQYYKIYDSFNLNQNLDVINGQEYIDVYKSLKRDNHKFYSSDDFFEGTVIYNSQPYYGLKIKYDLLNDLIILESINQKVNYLSLNSQFVTEFIIDNNKFVRLPISPVITEFYKNGFFKESFKGKEFSLFIKNIKYKNEVISRRKVLYTFRDKEIYILSSKNQYYLIDKIKDVTDVLSLNKKQIQLFYKENKKLFKKDKEQFLNKLFKLLEFNNV